MLITVPDGALFCTFNRNGNADKGKCYFKDIDGATPDEFQIRAR